jgi:hypothetical protein
MNNLLLAAYPARLRRRFGAELITTMAEAAGPTGPTRADRRRLVLDGLRERFRLPPRRPLAVVAAVLAMLVGGAIGAAAGSWLGMWTFPKAPDAVALASQAVGSDATLQPDSHRLWIFSRAAAGLNPGVDATEAAGHARDRLTAAGWRAGPVVVSGGTDGIHFRRAEFEAEKSGIGLVATVYYSDDHLVQIGTWSMQPATYLPLVIGGLVLGLLAGWLTAAALTYRIAGAGRRRAGAVTAGAGLALLLLPAWSIYQYLAWYLPGHDVEGPKEFVHRALASSPIWSLADRLNLGLGWTDSPWLNKELVIAGLAALAAAAVIARPGREEPFDPQVA